MNAKRYETPLPKKTCQLTTLERAVIGHLEGMN